MSKRIASVVFFGLMLLLAACGKDNNGSNTTPVVGGPGSNPGPVETRGTITDFQTILSSSDRNALVGRQVELDQVHVLKVYRNVFLIGSRDNQLPVAVAMKLRGHDDPNRHHVKQGDVLRIRGEIRSIANPENPSAFWMHVPSQAQSFMKQQQIYISAESIELSFPARASEML